MPDPGYAGIGTSQLTPAAAGSGPAGVTTAGMNAAIAAAVGALPAAGITAAQAAAIADAQAAAAIAAQVPPLIPKATAMRMFSQNSVQSGDTLTATTAAEQTYASQYTIPANSLVVGQVIHVHGNGVYTTPTVNLVSQRARLRLGGATLVDSAAQLFPISLASCRYEFYMHFIVRSLGAAGTVEASGRLIFATSLTSAITILCGPSGTTAGDTGNPVTIDTTKDNLLTLSCQFGAAQSGNSNSLRELSAHTMKPAT